MTDPIDIFMQHHAADQLEKLVFEAKWCNAVVDASGRSIHADLSESERGFYLTMMRAGKLANIVLRYRYKLKLKALPMMPFPVRIAARKALDIYLD